jgi:MFS transporter, PPP family, 3-phenylpropionic acid transporter
MRDLSNQQRKIASLYGAIFFVVGGYTAFLPLWLKSCDLTDADIALILALTMVLRPFASITFGILRDRAGAASRVAFYSSLAALASLILVALWRTHWAIAFGLAAHAVFSAPLIPLADAFALETVRDKSKYGRMRLFGSFGFVFASVLVGYAAAAFGSDSIIFSLIAGTLAVSLASWLVQKGLPPAGRRPGTHEEPHARHFIRAASLSRFGLFLIAASAVGSSHALYYTFGTAYMLSLGYTTTAAGILWSVAVLAEIVLFRFSEPIVTKVSPYGLMLAASLACILRWLMLSTEPAFFFLVLSQALHALTFGAYNLSYVFFIRQAFPRALGTAQGVFAALTGGIAMASVTALSGPYYELLHSRAFTLMAIIASLGLPVLGLMHRKGAPVSR